MTCVVCFIFKPTNYWFVHVKQNSKDSKENIFLTNTQELPTSILAKHLLKKELKFQKLNNNIRISLRYTLKHLMSISPCKCLETLCRSLRGNVLITIFRENAQKVQLRKCQSAHLNIVPKKILKLCAEDKQELHKQ